MRRNGDDSCMNDRLGALAPTAVPLSSCLVGDDLRMYVDEHAGSCARIFDAIEKLLAIPVSIIIPRDSALRAIEVAAPTASPSRSGVPPTRVLREVRVEASDDGTSVGDKILVDMFNENDLVDVIGKSKGRGFAGFVKRHGFAGGRASHGSMFHRAPGGIGASAYPSRVIKGTRMAGHMGDARKIVLERVGKFTFRPLRVVDIVLNLQVR